MAKARRSMRYASISKNTAWFQTDHIHLRLNKNINGAKIVSFAHQIRGPELQDVSPHSEHNLESAVIDKFTTNDDLLSASPSVKSVRLAAVFSQTILFSSQMVSCHSNR